MHIHISHASASGNALAGAEAEETAMSLRRARELREAAARLKAAALEVNSDLASIAPSDPQTMAQTVSMIGAWSGGGSSNNQADSQSPPEDTSAANASSRIQETQQVRRAPPSGPVSFWA